jgi:hypothetical protein
VTATLQIHKELWESIKEKNNRGHQKSSPCMLSLKKDQIGFTRKKVKQSEGGG